MEILEINKNLIPYTFNIVLYGEQFSFRVDYNNTAHLFTVSASKNGVDLCTGEPLVYGVPLFRDLFTRGGFPLVVITPYDMSGRYDSVTYDNLSSTVQLYVELNDDDVQIEQTTARAQSPASTSDSSSSTEVDAATLARIEALETEMDNLATVAHTGNINDLVQTDGDEVVWE